jgi:Pyridoxamine 5'-phosphate oxidase
MPSHYSHLEDSWTMVSWKEVGAGAPDFALCVEQALTRSRHMTMATLRADGAPRISGTELEVSEGELWLGSMPKARKALDLLRDPRVAIHGPTADPPDDPTGWIGEAKVSGRAVAVPSDDSSHRFRIDVAEVVFTHLNDAGDRLVVESWHPGRGVEVVERE